MLMTEQLRVYSKLQKNRSLYSIHSQLLSPGPMHGLLSMLPPPPPPIKGGFVPESVPLQRTQSGSGAVAIFEHLPLHRYWPSVHPAVSQVTGGVIDASPTHL